VRINPLFPIYPDGYYTDPHFDHARPVKPCNFFSWEMLEVIAQHKVPTVVVGMVRLYQFNLRFMRQVLGYDLRSHFADDVRQERAVLHFSAAETACYYTRIRELGATYGLRFRQLAADDPRRTHEGLYHAQALTVGTRISSGSEVSLRHRFSSSEQQTSTCSGHRICNSGGFTCWSVGALV
jgi:hypothetical protein